MTPIQKQRLLNVARALREAKVPEAFNMNIFCWSQDDFIEYDAEETFSCGTPACALGHYAARTDLQDLLVIKPTKDKGEFMMAYAKDKILRSAWYEDSRILDHFGIDEYGAEALFSSMGCGGAETTEDAAEYIENFVKDRS